MGWLNALWRDARVRIWAFTVLPTGLVFLIAGLVVRQLYWTNVQRTVGAGHPAAEQLTMVLGPHYALVGCLCAFVVSTVITSLLSHNLLGRLRALGRLAREMAQGNYTVRAGKELAATTVTAALAGELNALAESLERTDRQRRELVANLAHEIRTPLTNLQGYLEALRDGVIEPTGESLASLHEESMRLVRLVDALHQLARADSLKHHGPPVAPVELDRLVGSLLQVFRPAAEGRRIALLADLGARGKLVPAHVDSIAQVVRNLLKNAVQYTDEGGTIRVQTAVTDYTYYCTIINTGHGIAPTELPFVFQRFYRSEKARQSGSMGVGLGLAICKELVEAHGGRIGADSKAGWTTFWIELPLDVTDDALPTT